MYAVPPKKLWSSFMFLEWTNPLKLRFSWDSDVSLRHWVSDLTSLFLVGRICTCPGLMLILLSVSGEQFFETIQSSIKRLPVIRISSVQFKQVFYFKSAKTESAKRWKGAGELQSRWGVFPHWYKPVEVMKADYSRLFPSSWICQ